MGEHDAPPWPQGLRVPRWARDRDGGLDLPDVYSKLQLDNLDVYHVGLYRFRGWFPHVVEITEHPRDSRPPAVRITRVVWPRDPLVVFEAAETRAVGRSIYFGDHRNRQLRGRR